MISQEGERPARQAQPGAGILVVVTVAFLAELGVWLAYGLVSYRLTDGLPVGVRLAVALAAVVVVVAVWAVFVSPRARVQLPEPVRIGVKILIMGAAALLIGLSGSPWAGVVLGAASAFTVAVDPLTRRVARDNAPPDGPAR